MARPPKPTELKILQGTFKPSRALDNASDPEPVVDVPAAPDSLEGVAATKWDQVAGHMIDTGTLRVTDLDALESYCLAYEVMVTTAREVRVDGSTKVTAQGTTVRNPTTSVLAAAQAELRMLSTLLGLNPSARTKVAGKAPEKKNTIGDLRRPAR